MKAGDSEMVERVARALCKADGWGNPDMALSINDSAFGGPVDDCARPVWRRYVERARAAILSMKEPTEVMILAAKDHAHLGLSVAESWRSMIDAALSQKQDEWK